MDQFNRPSGTQQEPEHTPSEGWQRVNLSDEDPFQQQTGTPPFDSFSSGDQGSDCPPPNPHNGLKVFIICVCVAAVIGLIIYVGWIGYQQEVTRIDLPSSALESNVGAEPESTASLSINQVPQPTESKAVAESTGEMSTEAIATKVMPSVVGISVASNINGEIITAEASGIIMTSDGYIITNAHVVLQDNTQIPVDKIDVYLDNGQNYEARLIGADVKTDLAVVKIQETNLIAAEFGDSSAIKVGERAIAIGNPYSFSLSSSLTQGVVSGVNRVLSGNTTSENTTYIQTDAAINPGNSGGALVNKYGQVIGINTAKITRTDYEGIGFAIPINEAKPIIDAIISKGYVSGRVRIGITCTTVSESMAELLDVPAGLRIVLVDETTDAYAKGITKGDIITHIEGQSVRAVTDISGILKGKQPGDLITMTIYRIEDGTGFTINITIALEEDTSGQIVEGTQESRFE